MSINRKKIAGYEFEFRKLPVMAQLKYSKRITKLGEMAEKKMSDVRLFEEAMNPDDIVFILTESRCNCMNFPTSNGDEVEVPVVEVLDDISLDMLELAELFNAIIEKSYEKTLRAQNNR